MGRFSQKIAEGLNNAKIALENKREIESVFAELDADIQAATTPKISVAILEGMTNLDHITRFFRGSGPHHGIFVFKRSAGIDSAQFVAGWVEGSEGYPCIIDFGKTEISCADRTALEDMLSEIFSTALVGRLIKKAQVYKKVEKRAK
jgi:hypothetical protein